MTITPTVLGVAFPAGRFPSAKAAADALFEMDTTAIAPDEVLTFDELRALFPIGCYGVPFQPFRGVDRYDVHAYRLDDELRFDAEITPEWIRLYLWPDPDGEIRGTELVDEIVRVTGGKAVE